MKTQNSLLFLKTQLVIFLGEFPPFNWLNIKSFITHCNMTLAESAGTRFR